MVLTNERPILSQKSRKMAICYWLAAINDQPPLSTTTTSEKQTTKSIQSGNFQRLKVAKKKKQRRRASTAGRWIIIGVRDTTTTLSPLVSLAFLGLNGSSYLQQHLTSFSPSFLSSSADNHLPGRERHSFQWPIPSLIMISTSLFEEEGKKRLCPQH